MAEAIIAVPEAAVEKCEGCHRPFHQDWEKLVNKPSDKPRCSDHDITDVDGKVHHIKGCGRPFTGAVADLCEKGDVKVMWDKDNPDEVDAARVQFESLIKKGYWAYKAQGAKGEKGERITTFDPNAERLIMAKQMQGG